ncbi:hypothetical protein [Brevibacterium sp. p3-SID960]|uniref:hypothetical protein n=1 Tax=Brevibacterium sp. p3-SID960 TaxID=2916063 RepID=UPI0037BEEDA3
MADIVSPESISRNARIARVCADLGITRARRGHPPDFRGDATHRAVRTDVRSIIPISPPDALGTQFTSQLH